MTISVRIPTRERNEVQARLSTKKLVDLDELHTKMSTGYNETFYSQAPDETRTVLQSSCNLLRTEHQLKMNKLLKKDLDNYFLQLNTMNEILEDFKKSCVQSINSAVYDEVIFKEQSKAYEEQFIGLLNSKDVNGKYLFSGTVTNTAPIDMTKYPAALPAPSTLADSTAAAAADRATILTFLDTPHIEYYQGNTKSASYNISDGYPLLELPINALDPCIEQALRAFRGAQEVEKKETDNFDILGKVSDIASAAQKKLIDGPKLMVGNICEKIDLVNKKLEQEKNFFDGIFKSTANAPLLEANNYMFQKNNIDFQNTLLADSARMSRQFLDLLKI